MVKRHWYSKPLATCTDIEGNLSPGHRLTGRTVAIAGVEILVLAAYFLSGGDLQSPTNIGILKQVDHLTRGGNTPFILGADFNFEECSWVESVFPWLRKLQATTVSPDNSSYTCKQREGVQCKIIDYFMISVCLRPLVAQCKVVLDAPWGTHLGVWLQINTEIDAALAKQLIKPNKKKGDELRLAEQAAQDLDSNSASKGKGGNSKSNPLVEPDNADPWLWKQALSMADSQTVLLEAKKGQQEARQACSEYALELGIYEQAHKVGHGLAIWGNATSNYINVLNRKLATPLPGSKTSKQASAPSLSSRCFPSCPEPSTQSIATTCQGEAIWRPDCGKHS